jgi:gamma-glutamylcyclotransferase (GGCT)/AIG2-like uncharacterized protein YtfP
MKYFAYGSNMSMDYMRQSCPSARFLMLAQLPNFHIEFRRYSEKYQGGISSIIQAPGEMVKGVLYDVDEKEFAALDILESVPQNIYRRETFFVFGKDGEWHHAELYRVTDPAGPYTPAAKYVDRMITGAKEHGVDPEYTANLVALRQSLG